MRAKRQPAASLTCVEYTGIAWRVAPARMPMPAGNRDCNTRLACGVSRVAMILREMAEFRPAATSKSPAPLLPRILRCAVQLAASAAAAAALEPARQFCVLLRRGRARILLCSTVCGRCIAAERRRRQAAVGRELGAGDAASCTRRPKRCWSPAPRRGSAGRRPSCSPPGLPRAWPACGGAARASRCPRRPPGTEPVQLDVTCARRTWRAVGRRGSTPSAPTGCSPW